MSFTLTPSDENKEQNQILQHRHYYWTELNQHWWLKLNNDVAAFCGNAYSWTELTLKFDEIHTIIDMNWTK